MVSRRGVERAFDQAEILEVFDLSALEGQLERNRHRRAPPRVRAVLSEHYSGQTPTWSELEEAVLALCRSVGIPPPEVNAFVVAPDGSAMRVDFLWRAQRLAVESDGHQTHRTRQAFERDRRRDQCLTLAGWRPIRVTWRQIQNDAVALAETLHALLGA